MKILPIFQPKTLFAICCRSPGVFTLPMIDDKNIFPPPFQKFYLVFTTPGSLSGPTKLGVGAISAVINLLWLRGDIQVNNTQNIPCNGLQFSLSFSIQKYGFFPLLFRKPQFAAGINTFIFQLFQIKRQLHPGAFLKTGTLFDLADNQFAAFMFDDIQLQMPQADLFLLALITLFVNKPANLDVAVILVGRNLTAHQPYFAVADVVIPDQGGGDMEVGDGHEKNLLRIP